LNVLARRNVVTGCTAMFHRELLDVALPFPLHLPRVFHDGWLALVAAAIGEVRPVPEFLVRYRQHAGQQIGVARSRADLTAPAGYDRQIKILEELELALERAGLDSRERDPIYARIEHCRTRRDLPAGLASRVRVVLREYFDGDYSRYSNGLRSVARDITATRVDGVGMRGDA
jgi:hypothetical protein